MVLIVGASSGIGLACAQLLRDGGYRVYGAARRPVPGAAAWVPGSTQPGASAPGLMRSVQVDVRDDASVGDAVRQVVSAEGGIGALVYTAGYVLAGAVEDVAPSEMLAQFETNVAGALRVFRAVLPVMRRQGYGRIVVIGSVAGLIPVPYQSMYSASKYALEPVAEALRMEAGRFGIKVTIVEPGDIRTEITAARVWAAAAERADSPYRDRAVRAVAAMAKSEQAGPGPEIVARAVARVLGQPHPPVRVVVGASYKAIAWARKFIPDKLLHYILGRMYG